MKMTKKWSILLAIVLVIGTISPAFGVSLEKPSANDGLPATISYTEPDEVVRVIVELEQSPILDRAIQSGVRYQDLDNAQVTTLNEELMNVQNDVKSKIHAFSDGVEFRHNYTKVYNGFSADVEYRDIKLIKALPSVKNVYIAKKYTLPEPQMATSHGMIGSETVWNLDYKGEGMLVAVLDTGIDFEHPDFALTNDASGKISQADLETLFTDVELSAEEFYASEGGTLTAADVYKSAKVPFAFDYADIDTDAKPDIQKPQASEHGVHVSGTVGANGAIKGVAPEAQIAAMKVFSDDIPYAYEDDIVAGIDDAVAIGADVINMSLGSTAGFTDDTEPDQEAILRAKEAGLVVAVSAGNSNRFGDGFLYLTFPWNPDTALVGSPSAGNGTLSVASIENTYARMSYLLSEQDTKMQFSAAGNLDPSTEFGPSETYVYCGFGGTDEFEGLELEGKIALISRGDFAFTDKIINAEANGAKGVIVFNNAGEELINMMYPETGTIPALFIGQTHGEELRNAEVKTIAFDASYVDGFPNVGAGEMSPFTSWGPTPSLDFKPEITAPGGDIYSTMNDGKYASMSGTSMAAPHIAGASAIMLEYVNENFPSLTPKAAAQFAKALMMSTADPVMAPNGSYYSPRRQGAGILDLYSAVTSEVYAYDGLETKEAKIALYEIDQHIFEFDVVVENFGSNPHEFVISAEALTDGTHPLDNRYATGDPVDLSGAVIRVSGDALQTAKITSSSIYEVTPAVEVNSVNVYQAENLLSTTPSPVVILPIDSDSTEVVTVTVDLTQVMEDNELIASDVYGAYFNGFFAEGFVRFINLDENDTQPDFGIPYMGFVGEWSKAPIFDNDVYGLYGDSLDFSPYLDGPQAMIDVYETEEGHSGDLLGQNLLTEEAHADWISISPDGDGYKENAAILMSMLRNAKSIDVRLLDEEGNFIDFISLNEIFNVRKEFLSNGVFSQYHFPTPDNELASLIWDGKVDGEVVEGQYYYEVQASVEVGDSGLHTQFYHYPIFVDVSAPEVVRAYMVGTMLTVEATDNHAIMMYEVVDKDGNVLAESHEATFDVNQTAIVGNTIRLTDYAGNETEWVYTVPSNDGDTDSGSSTPPAPAPETTEPATVETPGQVDPSDVKVVIGNEGTKVSVAEEAIKKAIASSENKEVVIELPETLDTDKQVEVTIPVAAMKALEEAGGSVVIKGKNIEFKLESGFADLSGDNVVITMEKAEVDEVPQNGDYESIALAYDFDLLINNEKVTSFNKKPMITITLPEDVVNPERVGAYILGEDGTWEFVMTVYNKEMKTVSFKAPHFSVYSLIKFNKTFEDIQGHWAQASIEEMASKHVTDGVSETLFAPEKTITRAEFAAMLLKAMGETESGDGTFNDVTADKWYAGFLGKGLDIGLIQADESGNFRPMDAITREEMATMTTRAHIIINNIDTADHTPSITFDDVSEISSEHIGSVSYAQENGLIEGYMNKFNPKDRAKRAEALTIIKRMLEK